MEERGERDGERHRRDDGAGPRAGQGRAAAGLSPGALGRAGFPAVCACPRPGGCVRGCGCGAAAAASPSGARPRGCAAAAGAAAGVLAGTSPSTHTFALTHAPPAPSAAAPANFSSLPRRPGAAARLGPGAQLRGRSAAPGGSRSPRGRACRGMAPLISSDIFSLALVLSAGSSASPPPPPSVFPPPSSFPDDRTRASSLLAKGKSIFNRFN